MSWGGKKTHKTTVITQSFEINHTRALYIKSVSFNKNRIWKEIHNFKSPYIRKWENQLTNNETQGQCGHGGSLVFKSSGNPSWQPSKPYKTPPSKNKTYQQKTHIEPLQTRWQENPGIWTDASNWPQQDVATKSHPQKEKVTPWAETWANRSESILCGEEKSHSLEVVGTAKITVCGHGRNKLGVSLSPWKSQTDTAINSFLKERALLRESYWKQKPNWAGQEPWVSARESLDGRREGALWKGSQKIPKCNMWNRERVLEG